MDDRGQEPNEVGKLDGEMTPYLTALEALVE